MAERGAERIAGERTAGKAGARRRERSHDVRTSAERRERKTATGDFTERGQIGPLRTVRLRAAHAQAQPRDHFIEDDQRAARTRAHEETVEKSRRRHDEPHVCGDGFDDDRRQIVRACGELGVEVGEIAVARDDRFCTRARRDAVVQRHASVRLRGRACTAEHEVEVSVIISGEARDPAASCEGARDSHRAHHRFGAGARKPQAFERRHVRANPLGELLLRHACRAEDRSASSDRVESGDQRGMRVAEEQRPVGHQVVDVGAALRIVCVCPASFCLHERSAAHGNATAHGRAGTVR